jgi:hypothetical protein
MRRAVGSGSDDRFSCIKRAWCTAELDSSYVLTVIENAAYLGPACDTADIVTTAVRLRFGTCKSGSSLFTGESLRKSGTVEMRINEVHPKSLPSISSIVRRRAITPTIGVTAHLPRHPCHLVSDNGE